MEEQIIDAVPAEVLDYEIQKIRKEHFLFQASSFQVFCAPAQDIPVILTELGRLRELTFRKIGEGTNKRMDLDEFDLHYFHLFIWDEEAKKIVGAYRLGKGMELFSEFGIHGFYTRTLFKMKKRFVPFLQQSIELGRSFIVPEYQRKAMPLFLLWKGILHFLLSNPEYRYLLGPVSISNRFSNFSKSIMVGFIQQHYFNHDLAKYVRPRKRFSPAPVTHADMDILFETADDIDMLDRLISDIEGDYRMPVLLRRYLQLNGRIIGFNIDPKFNECLDGLLLLDLYDVPLEKISGRFNGWIDETFIERFSSENKRVQSNEPTYFY